MRIMSGFSVSVRAWSSLNLPSSPLAFQVSRMSLFWWLFRVNCIFGKWSGGFVTVVGRPLPLSVWLLIREPWRTFY